MTCRPRSSCAEPRSRDRSTSGGNVLQRAFDAGAVPAGLIAPGHAHRSTEGPRSIADTALHVQRLAPGDRDRVAALLAERIGPDPPGSGMPADDVRRLALSGFDIGFHTRRHDELPPLDDESLHRAMRDGRKAVEELSVRRLSAIAYPHGAADERVASAARGAGFTVGFTTEAHPVRASSDPIAAGATRAGARLGGALRPQPGQSSQTRALTPFHLPESRTS